MGWYIGYWYHSTHICTGDNLVEYGTDNMGFTYIHLQVFTEISGCCVADCKTGYECYFGVVITNPETMGCLLKEEIDQIFVRVGYETSPPNQQM